MYEVDVLMFISTSSDRIDEGKFWVDGTFVVEEECGVDSKFIVDGTFGGTIANDEYIVVFRTTVKYINKYLVQFTLKLV